MEILTSQENFNMLLDWAVDEPDQVISNSLTQLGFLKRVELLNTIRIHFFENGAASICALNNEESFVH